MKSTAIFVCAFIIALASGCMVSQPAQNVRFTEDLQEKNCQLPEGLIPSVTIEGHTINLIVNNDTNEVWRLDWNSCSVAQDPSGWQSKLVDGQATIANKNDVKPPLVISPGRVETQMFPADLFQYAAYVGTYWKPWPIPDGGLLKVILGFRDADDKLHFCIIAGNLSTKVIK